MTGQLRFEGRVVVITGAGSGLGRAYALLFGLRGASVLVNDLGGNRHGDGSGTKAADAVVQEIRNKGGKAVADYHSVEDGDKIIQTALDNFGRIDVVVNNAGIIRDRSFANISNADWDMIDRVHVKGTFKTTQAVWPHFKKQKYGRVIVTSSTSGLHGNFGQANYAAAKMAVVGLSNTLAVEGCKYNINCNVIVPMAASRLTEDIVPQEELAEMRPELIAPVVVWLCHESCKETGSIIKSAVGWAGKYQLVCSQGTMLRAKATDEVTPENVRENWGRVADMSAAQHFSSNKEATESVMTALQQFKGVSKPYTSGKADAGVITYETRDVILYALGVGASVSNSEELKFLYEHHPQFSVLPTFFIFPALVTFIYPSLTNLLGKNIDPAKILHGEQYLEVFKPLQTSGTLRSCAEVVDVLDKGSGAVIIVDVETFDEKGEKVAFNQTITFVLGAGGSGGKRVSTKAVVPVKAPDRAPDAVVEQSTSLDQAALFRLSGDWNPLHIDPELVTSSRPSLHGLCYLGFCVRHVLQRFANNNPVKFKAVKVRLTKPFFPGQTIQTFMWEEGTRIHFEARIAETGDTVIAGAYVELTQVMVADRLLVGKPQETLKSNNVMEAVKARLVANVKKVTEIGEVFIYIITVDNREVTTWTIDLKKGDSYPGPPKNDKVNCTLTMSDADFVDLVSGKLNPQLAFVQGKLKVHGSLALPTKLQELMWEQAKL